MSSRTRTWQQKYDARTEPSVEVLQKPAAGMQAGQRMLIATPAIINEYLQAIPAGQAVSVATLRRDLAATHDADVTCPLTTGIFLRIVSERAVEQINAGASPSDVAPFWRVVEPTSPLARKLSVGGAWIQQRRQAEGIQA